MPLLSISAHTRHRNLAARLQRASELAESGNQNGVLLRHIEDAKMRDELRKLDGTHLAAEALKAFHDGDVIGQHNLLSTATDDERRAALERVLKWWNLARSPVYDRLRTARADATGASTVTGGENHDKAPQRDRVRSARARPRGGR